MPKKIQPKFDLVDPALKKKGGWPYWPYLACITFLKTKQNKKQKLMLPVVCYNDVKSKPKNCACRKDYMEIEKTHQPLNRSYL